MRLHKSAWLLAASLLALVPTTGGIGCAEAGGFADDGSGAVTTVPYTAVKDQSTGNCWIYATVGWTESLVKSASGMDLDLSESYVTYWHWYDEILAGSVSVGDAGSIIEGGFWGHAGDLMLKYGIMAEADFIPEEGSTIRSARQKTAVDAINASLRTGDLRTAEARRDRSKVRAAMDKAWGLDDGVKATLDKAFGPAVSKSVAFDYKTDPLPDGVKITKLSDLPAKLKNPMSGQIEARSVADAVGAATSSYLPDLRTGTFAWQSVSYPAEAKARHDLLTRVERSLNDHLPVVLIWYVDFNALDANGHFTAPPAHPGSGGGHLSLLYDYQVEDVPGFGTLAVGVEETRPDALAAALSDAANVTILRIKNSWSPTYHALPAPAPGGYHDLYLKYLNGPIQKCALDANENVIDGGACEDAVPFEGLVLPAGY